MAGDVAVITSDDQHAHAVDRDRYGRLAHDALLDSGVAGDAELNLLFVDESEMARLNEQHMGHQGPTDVLSFPIDADGPDGPGPRLLGDLVVCPAVAARNAITHGRSFPDEVALLVVHGVLHVLGFDHADPDEAAVMSAREQALLSRWWTS